MNAPCYGQHKLFDSIKIDDHRAAKALCDACPMIAACQALFADVEASCVSGVRPIGTWAGRLIGYQGRIPEGVDAIRVVNPNRTWVHGSCKTCGRATEGKRWYCDPCQVEARRAAWRRKERRKTARRRAEAA